MLTAQQNTTHIKEISTKNRKKYCCSVKTNEIVYKHYYLLEP
jgi:hypothetical protein